jgi:hypothetical protein
MIHETHLPPSIPPPYPLSDQPSPVRPFYRRFLPPRLPVGGAQSSLSADCARSNDCEMPVSWFILSAAARSERVGRQTCRPGHLAGACSAHGGFKCCGGVCTDVLANASNCSVWSVARPLEHTAPAPLRPGSDGSSPNQWPMENLNLELTRPRRRGPVEDLRLVVGGAAQS